MFSKLLSKNVVGAAMLGGFSSLVSAYDLTVKLDKGTLELASANIGEAYQLKVNPNSDCADKVKTVESDTSIVVSHPASCQKGAQFLLTVKNGSDVFVSMEHGVLEVKSTNLKKLSKLSASVKYGMIQSSNPGVWISRTSDFAGSTAEYSAANDGAKLKLEVKTGLINL